MLEDILEIIIIIICEIIFILTIFIIIIYCLNKSFKSIPCYFNIFFCINNSIDNILRLIPQSMGVDKSRETNKPTLICIIQAISLCIVDKYFTSLITIYSIIFYLGQFHVKFYKNYMKIIFISLIIIGFIFSCIFSIIYFIKDVVFLDDICFIENEIISDNIYTILLFFINIFCLIKIIIHTNKLKKNYINNMQPQNELACRKHLHRMIINLFMIIIYFIFIILFINRLLPEGNYQDLIFIMISLIFELFFTINEQFYNVVKNIVTCKKNIENEEILDRPTDYSIVDE